MLIIICSAGFDQEKIDTVTKKLKKSTSDSIEKHKQDSIYFNYLWEHREKMDTIGFSKSKGGKIWKHHQDWPKEDCIKLANREYWIGMLYEELVYLRGVPETVNISDYGNGSEYQWCWLDRSPSCFYGNSNKVITAFN